MTSVDVSIIRLDERGDIQDIAYFVHPRIHDIVGIMPSSPSTYGINVVHGPNSRSLGTASFSNSAPSNCSGSRPATDL